MSALRELNVIIPKEIMRRPYSNMTNSEFRLYVALRWLEQERADVDEPFKVEEFDLCQKASLTLPSVQGGLIGLKNLGIIEYERYKNYTIPNSKRSWKNYCTIKILV